MRTVKHFTVRKMFDMVLVMSKKTAGITLNMYTSWYELRRIIRGKGAHQQEDLVLRKTFNYKAAVLIPKPLCCTYHCGCGIYCW